METVKSHHLSTFSISCFVCGDHATQLNSSIGRTYTVNVLISSLESRDTMPY